MMKLKIILFVITQGLFSQSWVSQYSGTSNEVKDIFMIDVNTGYASCVGGILLRTTNSGINWISVPGPYTGTIVNVIFFDLNTGIVFSNPIYKTTNSGQNWLQVANLSGTLHHCMKADSNTAYGCQPFTLSKTINRGSTWGVTSGTPAWVTTSDYFLNSETGWVTTSQPVGLPNPTIYIAKIAKTTNGGMNWNILYNESGPPESNIMKDTYFPVEDTGYIIGKSGASIYSTFNGGINWLETNIGNVVLNDIFFINSKTGWAVSSNGYIYKTINSGTTWTNALTPYTGNLNKVFFINPETGWIVGGNGTILKSTNGGVTGINQLANEFPLQYSLSQNYPNPFNPQTKIKFDIPANVKGQTSNVKLVIYDLLGREITTLVNEELKPGTYEADWDGSNYSSGVYFYKIITEGFVETKKMLMVK